MLARTNNLQIAFACFEGNDTKKGVSVEMNCIATLKEKAASLLKEAALMFKMKSGVYRPKKELFLTAIWRTLAILKMKS